MRFTDPNFRIAQPFVLQGCKIEVDHGTNFGAHFPDGKPIADDVSLCDWLVEQGKVAVVPGSGFGAPGHVRLSYACSMDNIKEGVGRLRTALLSLR